LRFRWRTYLQESFWNWIEFSQFFVYIGYALEELYLGRSRESSIESREAAAALAALAASGTNSASNGIAGNTARLLKTVGKSSST